MAVAIGLRTAATGSVAGIEETSLRALAKLQQMLPARLRHRLSAFQAYALPVPSRGPRVDPEVLTTIASACRDHERLRFDYRAHSGAVSRRSANRIGWSTTGSAGTWWPGTQAARRGDPFGSTGSNPRGPGRAALRAPCASARPADRGAGGRGGRTAPWHYRARVIVHAPAAYVRERLPIPVPVESLGEDRCAFEPGSDHPEMLALYLGLLDADFEIADSPELAAALHKLADRYQRAIVAANPAADGRA